jgi:hypothetical protein
METFVDPSPYRRCSELSRRGRRPREPRDLGRKQLMSIPATPRDHLFERRLLDNLAGCNLDRVAVRSRPRSSILSFRKSSGQPARAPRRWPRARPGGLRRPGWLPHGSARPLGFLAGRRVKGARSKRPTGVAPGRDRARRRQPYRISRPPASRGSAGAALRESVFATPAAAGRCGGCRADPAPRGHARRRQRQRAD